MALAGANASPNTGTKPPSDWAEDIVKRFELKVDAMSDRLNRLSADASKDCIRFGGLGFDSLSKASSWLAENVPDHAFGLIVDPHTVMEHIQSSIAGKACLPKMERLYKLKLLTIGEAVAMTSFENKVLNTCPRDLITRLYAWTSQTSTVCQIGAIGTKQSQDSERN